MTGEIKAIAEAVAAAAETKGKVIDAAAGVGKFLDRVFGPALNECGGMMHDNVRYWRAVNLIRLQERFDAIRAEKGLSDSIKAIPLKVGLPLIEAASLEEDDFLQDMFAKLLVNATDPESKIEAKRSFISILEDFGPLEAHILFAIANKPDDGKSYLNTAMLPTAYLDVGDDKAIPKPPPEVEIALWNLCRLGCIEPGGAWGGGSSVSTVAMTMLGSALIQACTA